MSLNSLSELFSSPCGELCYRTWKESLALEPVYFSEICSVVSVHLEVCVPFISKSESWTNETSVYYPNCFACSCVWTAFKFIVKSKTLKLMFTLSVRSPPTRLPNSTIHPQRTRTLRPYHISSWNIFNSVVMTEAKLLLHLNITDIRFDCSVSTCDDKKSNFINLQALAPTGKHEEGS